MTQADGILVFIRTHKDEIRQNFSVERIGLFGSQANNEATNESDLDFYVVFSRKSYRNLAGLYDYLERNLGKRIDIVTEHPHMRTTLRREIMESVRYG